MGIIDTIILWLLNSMGNIYRFLFIVFIIVSWANGWENADLFLILAITFGIAGAQSLAISGTDSCFWYGRL